MNNSIKESATTAEPSLTLPQMLSQFAFLVDGFDISLQRVRIVTDRMGISFYGSGAAPTPSDFGHITEKEVDGGVTYLSALQSTLRALQYRADLLAGTASCLEGQLPESAKLTNASAPIR